MKSLHQHAQVNIWKNKVQHISFDFQSWHCSSVLCLQVLKSWPPNFCWFWKPNCHGRTYSMRVAFKRALYNVVTFLGSQRLKTLWAGVSYLSSNISISEKFLTMTHLILKDLLFPGTSASICDMWTSAACLLKWGLAKQQDPRKNARPRCVDPPQLPSSQLCAPHLLKAAQLESQGRHPGALCSRSPLVIQQQPCSLAATVDRNMKIFTLKSQISRNWMFDACFRFNFGGQILNIEMRHISSACAWQEDLAPKTN